MAPALSLILPANNEAAHIARCLDAVLASAPVAGAVQVIVVPNGCTDDTAQIARGYAQAFCEKGWAFEVIELAEGSKLAALDAGDAAAHGAALAYLDADVIVSPPLLHQTAEALAGEAPRYATGTVQITRAGSAITRAYTTFYLRTPFMRQRAPGCGFFAMNRAGRARWGAWPRIISDDTFARLNFAPDERVQVAAVYDWPLVEGLGNLIRVRRRQNAGVDEIAREHPQLLENDAKTRFARKDLARTVLRHPIGTLVYGIVAMTVKLTPGATNDWRRGR